MQITLKNKTFRLPAKDVKLAKKMYLEYYDTIKKKAEELRRPDFPLTYLVISQAISQTLLDMMDEDVLQMIMDGVTNTLEKQEESENEKDG